MSGVPAVASNVLSVPRTMKSAHHRQAKFKQLHLHKPFFNSEDRIVFLEETSGRINPPWF